MPRWTREANGGSAISEASPPDPPRGNAMLIRNGTVMRGDFTLARTDLLLEGETISAVGEQKGEG